MSKITTTIFSTAAAAAAAGVALAATAGGASAATAPASLMAYKAPVVHVATGQVELGSPLQYESFLASQGGPSHGVVDYTNFAYTEPGSGVFAPSGSAQPLTFTFAGTPYAHTLNGGLKLRAVSPDQLNFSGTGSYNGQQGATWKIVGSVKDGEVSFKIVYTGTLSPGYSLTATGKIAADGSASGTATSSTGQALSWAEGAGAWTPVLHYVAPVQSAKVDAKHHNATFNFTIPAKVAGLAGTKVTVTVHDGGWGAAHDTYAHGVTGGAQTAYPIIGGPGITVQ
jgi:hypothetical protein